MSYLKKNASIINISSISSYFGFPNNPGYVSSKSGLSGLTRSLAYDFSKKNIRVNNIVPGYIRTEMTKKSFNNKKLFNLRKSSTLLNRWGNPKDIIGACTFLVSSSSSYITGADIVIDGGWSVKGI
jgi:NAD(P)-dependent dehydrogenase (short-subunit alcohol dehydrogenase family)